MPDLSEFQADFVRDLIRGAPPETGPYTDPAFAVYRNTWRKALREALQANYPVVAMLIGDETFHTLANHYIGQSGPTSPILSGYGADLADVIVASPLHEMVPYLANMAGLERLVSEARDAPDAQPIEPDFFAKLSPQDAETLTLALIPAARLALTETPVITIWNAHQGPDKPDGLSPDWIPEQGLVVRRSTGVIIETLDDQMLAFVSVLHRGETLGVAAGETLAHHPDADIAAILTRITATKAFTTY